MSSDFIKGAKWSFSEQPWKPSDKKRLKAWARNRKSRDKNSSVGIWPFHWALFGCLHLFSLPKQIALTLVCTAAVNGSAAVRLRSLIHLQLGHNRNKRITQLQLERLVCNCPSPSSLNGPHRTRPAGPGYLMYYANWKLASPMFGRHKGVRSTSLAVGFVNWIAQEKLSLSRCEFSFEWSLSTKLFQKLFLLSRKWCTKTPTSLTVLLFTLDLFVTKDFSSWENWRYTGHQQHRT